MLRKALVLGRDGAAGWLAVAGVAIAIMLVSPSPARADCVLTGSAIVCAPPGTNGYSDPAGNGFTITVQPGTTVVDNGFAAIELNNANVIVNNGLIAAGDSAAGIVVNDGNTITNNSVMTAGANGAGISAGDDNTIVNAGSITIGDGFGSYGIATLLNSTIVNSGSITVGQGGIGIAADANTTLPSTPSITNSGTVTVGDFGIGIIVTDNHNILNSGRIVVGRGGFGIQARDGNLISNTGNILVDSFSGGVEFTGVNNTLNNSGTISAINGSFSVQTCGCSANDNRINNLVGGTLDGYISIDGAGNTVTNSGLIAVTDPGTPLIGYPTFLIANQGGTGAGNAFVQTASGTLALRMDNTGLIDNLSADAITAGGTLKVMLQPGQFYQNSTTSGTAAGLTVYGVGVLGNTITTRFDTFTTSSAFFTATPIYDTADPNNYTSLAIQLDRLPFGGVPGSTPNQTAVGNVLERGYSPGLDPASTIGQFYLNLLNSGSLSVLDQLSGAGTAASQDAAFNVGDLFSVAMLQQAMAWLSGSGGAPGVTFGGLGYAPAGQSNFANRRGADAFGAMQPSEGRWRVWGSGFGATRSIDGQWGTADQRTDAAGGLFGVDRQIAPDLLIGAAVGASNSRFSVSSLSTSGHADAGHVGLYALKTFGAAYLAGALHYAHASNDTDRTISGIGITEQAKGSFDSDQFGGRLELGWRTVVKDITLTPFAAIAPTTLWQQGYSETSTTSTGAPGILGLTYQSNRVSSFPGFLGLQVDGRFTFDNGTTLSPFARVSWVHEFDTTRSITASFINITGGSFTTEGASADANALRLEGGGSYALNPRASLFASVNSQLSSHAQSLAGMGGLRLGW